MPYAEGVKAADACATYPPYDQHAGRLNIVFWLYEAVMPNAPFTVRVNEEFSFGIVPVGTVGLAQLLANDAAATLGMPPSVATGERLTKNKATTKTEITILDFMITSLCVRGRQSI